MSEVSQIKRQTRGAKMADLPVHRLAEAPPFIYCGVDMFG